jgi:hypothetical protein
MPFGFPSESAFGFAGILTAGRNGTRVRAEPVHQARERYRQRARRQTHPPPDPAQRAAAAGGGGASFANHEIQNWVPYLAVYEICALHKSGWDPWVPGGVKAGKIGGHGKCSKFEQLHLVRFSSRMCASPLGGWRKGLVRRDSAINPRNDEVRINATPLAPLGDGESYAIDGEQSGISSVVVLFLQVASAHNLLKL